VHEFELEVEDVGDAAADDDDDDEMVWVVMEMVMDVEEEKNVPNKFSPASLSMLICFPRKKARGWGLIREEQRMSEGHIKIEVFVYYDSPKRTWIYIKRKEKEETNLKKRKRKRKEEKKRKRNINQHVEVE